jgi:hypothetical protein
VIAQRATGPGYEPDSVAILMTRAEAEDLYKTLQAIPSHIFNIDAVRNLHSALVEWRK